MNSPRTWYQIGTAILFIAVLALIVEILGMVDVISKYAPPRAVNMVAIILIILAGGIRRRARAAMMAGGADSR